MSGEQAIILQGGELIVHGYRCVVSETALILPNHLPYQSWEALGNTLQQMGRSVQWWIGDWIRYGEHRYGEKYSQAVEETAYAPGYLRNMVYVASRIEPGRRRNNLSWSHHLEVAPLPEVDQEAWLSRAEEESWSRADLRARLDRRDTGRVIWSSASDEWLTPPDIIARCVQVMGGIDLDPCSDAAHSVPAERHYTIEHDGLAQDWAGRVFVNPPFSRCDEFVKKAVAEWFMRGTETIILVAARTDTEWFRPLFGFPICFLHGRLHFGGVKGPAPFPSVLVYLAATHDRFAARFEDIGTTCTQIRSDGRWQA